MPPRAPQARRQVILDRAAALFARKGVAATTVREIADDVGILSGSLYHHFKSKEAMVDEVLSSFFDELRSRYKEVLASDAGARVRLHDMVVASLEVGQAHPHAIAIYQNDVNYLSQLDRFAYLRNAAREVQASWLAVINAGIAEGVFRRDVDPKIVYSLLRDSLWLSVRWFKATRDYPATRLAEDCTSLFLDGLAARPTRTR
jgi:AcrR family transcriptional regulator